MRELGFYDGRIVDLDQPQVSLEDRGHQFGDGVYEVAVAYEGKYFALPEHLDRLERSCREIRLTPCYSRQEIEGFCQMLLEESQIKEAMLYIQWTRGTSPRFHGFPAASRPLLSMTLRHRRIPSPEIYTEGAKAILIPDERWLRCDIKSISLLGTVLAKQKAIDAGCYEAILERDGLVTEGSSSNSFAVKDGVIYTAPVGNLILAGITRAKVIQLAREAGYIIKEEFVTSDFYFQADEVFLTVTTGEVAPVTLINGKLIGDGKVGPLSKDLHRRFIKLTGRA